MAEILEVRKRRPRAKGAREIIVRVSRIHKIDVHGRWRYAIKIAGLCEVTDCEVEDRAGLEAVLIRVRAYAKKQDATVVLHRAGFDAYRVSKSR